MSDTNPIKDFRARHNLSQQAFASLAGVTVQVIVRCEIGTYTEIPPSVVRAIDAIDKQVTGEAVALMYERWLLEELKEVKLPYRPTLDQLHTIEGFEQFRKDLTEANDVSDSNYSMSKLLKVHIYPIDRYLSGRKNTPPVQIMERISEIQMLQGTGESVGTGRPS